MINDQKTCEERCRLSLSHSQRGGGMVEEGEGENELLTADKECVREFPVPPPPPLSLSRRPVCVCVWHPHS